MPAPCTFRSAFTSGHVDPAVILAFHRSTFGDTRMEVDPANDGGSGDQGGDGNKGEVGPNGFPESTPIADMKPEHQAAYWKHQSRKHEDTAKARADYEAIKAERDQLKASTQTDAEKAITDARADERAKAEKDTAGKYQARLVAAEVKAALASTKFPADKIAGQVEFLDHTKFLTADGEVDADKVKQYAAGLAPTGGTWPDMGGGKRGRNTTGKGVSAGADMYAASRGKTT